MNRLAVVGLGLLVLHQGLRFYHLLGWLREQRSSADYPSSTVVERAQAVVYQSADQGWEDPAFSGVEV